MKAKHYTITEARGSILEIVAGFQHDRYAEITNRGVTVAAVVPIAWVQALEAASGREARRARSRIRAFLKGSTSKRERSEPADAALLHG